MAKANIEIVLSNGEKAGNSINKLRQQANALTKEINKWDVGTKEFEKAQADLQKVAPKLKALRQEAYGLSQANQSVVSTFSQYIPFGGSLRSMAAGARTGVVAFKSLRAAIAATGIGLLVLAIASVVSWFKRTEQGAQTLRVIMAGLGQFVDSFMDIITGLGEAIFKAFSNPKEAVIGLWEIIKSQVINRVTGIIDTFRFLGKTIESAFNLDWEGVKKNAAAAGESIAQSITGVDDVGNKLVATFNKAKDAISGTFSELKNDAQAAMALARDENNLRVRNREFLVEQAKYEAEIAKLREYATDVTRTDQERQQALAESARLLNELSDKKIALKAEELRILQEQQAISITDEEGYEKEAQLQAELIRLQEERAATMRRITSQESALRDKINRETEAEAKKTAETELKIVQELEDLKIEAMQEGEEKAIAEKELQFQRKIENLIGTEEQIKEQEKLLLEIKEQELQEIRDKYAGERKKKEDEERDARLKKEQEDAEKRKKIQEIYNTALEDIENAKRETFQTTTAVLADLLEQDAKNVEIAKGIRKAAALVDIALNLQNQISNINLTATQIAATIPPPFGVAISKAYSIASKTAAIAGAISQANEVRKMEDGGLLVGPRHYNRGIPATITSTGEPIELEGGEYVLRRTAVQALGTPYLDFLNSRKYEAGGPINPFSRSSVTTTAAPTQGASSSSGADSQTAAAADNSMAMLQEFRAFRQEVSTWQRNLKVNNNLQEVKGGLTQLNNLQDQSEV
ncbi:hypothetical protein [Roseivirga thermotolerans]|uniref:Bacteriophage tail tape measure N-terminal domain-containing protein n=1 Tax=Roseivirga thermotolerans TaxID=1758176 RepID=A0ABQ3I5M1_9BACT|nr:hypothetical protein [Roseivirga thermotolerans]GHE65056.1 hypothetical protein GCM10011340_20110 [Roseivirga thermotolerans]